MKVLTFCILITLGYLRLHAQTASEAPYLKIRLTDSVRCTPVKDQASSPTCWVFGTNSLFESDLLKKYDTEFNLSEMFIARYAYIDKAKQFLASKGKTYCQGGGQFHDVIRIVNRYGIMPEEAYNGRPGGEAYHNHARLDTFMKKFIHRLVQEKKSAFSDEEMQQMNDTLDRYLGKVPETFVYNGKTYTPKTFAADVVKFDNDYVELMSFANLPYYKKCLLDDKFNWAGDSLYNIPLDDFQMLVDSALAKGWSVGWEGDVTNDGFNSFRGYANLILVYKKYDDIRVHNYKIELTERDHMLHITGAGKDENNKRWYYLKNSWGTWLNPYKGFLYMDENYFRLNTVVLMVNKAALPESLKEKLGILE